MPSPLPGQSGFSGECERIAAFFQEALDETEGMELPHAHHLLRVKVASRISALRTVVEKQEGGDRG